MAFTKNNKIIFILCFSIAAGLGLSSAVIGNIYEKNKQETYNRCVETSANILIKDGNTPSNEILNVAKEACQGYGETKESPGVMLAMIAIVIMLFTYFLFMFTL